MRQIRIAMIGQKGVPATIGGIERHVEELGARLAAGGFDVTAYARPWYVGRRAGGTLRHRGMRVIVLRSWHTKHLDAISHTLVATFHAMRERSDIYHFHGVGPSLCAFLPWLLRPRARVIATFHCVDRKHAKWGLFARATLAVGEWAACRFPHETITVGETLAAYCTQQYGRVTTCIPNGVAAPDVHAACAPSAQDALRMVGLTPGQYLLVVSRFVEHKDIHRVIAAVRQMRRERPDLAQVQLAIIGEPSFTDAYGADLRRLAGGDAAIRFLGQRTGQVLDALYANCLAFVHASRSEGLPIVLLEAAAAGAVPIVSDIPEHREVIAKIGGFMFRTGDTWDLQTKLEVVIGSRAALPAIGADIRAKVLRHYHWDDVARATAERYAHTVASGARRERPARLVPVQAIIG